MEKKFLLICVLIFILYHILWLPFQKKSAFPWKEIIVVIPFVVLIGMMILAPATMSIFQTQILLTVLGSEFIIFPLLAQIDRKQKRVVCVAKATATVTGNKREKALRRRTFSYSYLPILTFDTETEKKELTYRNGMPQPMEIGRQIAILYNPKQPDEILFVNENEDVAARIVYPVFLTIGIFLTAIGIISLLHAVIG